MIGKLTTVCAAMAIAACGGGGSGPPMGPSGTQTETFTGTAQIVGAGCSGSGSTHPFNAGEGNLTVTLVQSAGSVSLAVQVCHPTAVNHALECTIPPFARIAVGETVSALLKGGRAQTLVVYPSSCGTPDQAPTPPIPYTVRVTHPA